MIRIKKLSIIVPMYKSEKNIKVTYERLKNEVISCIDMEVELLFVDDGSPDNSSDEVLKLEGRNIKLIRLSRNFGMHAAILAGMNYSKGNCICSISADLQDPPDLIVQMVRHWENGNKSMIAVRKERRDSFLSSAISNFYYKLMRRFALKEMPVGGFDCYLIDESIKNELVKMSEKNTSIFAQIIWCGYSPKLLYYVREDRKIGKSSWSFSKKVKLFIDSFVSFSYVPIRTASFTGILLSISGCLVSLFILYRRIVLNNVAEVGWSSLIIAMLLIGGIQLTTLGIIGEYLWRNLDEARNRPNYIVDDVIEVK